MRRTAFRPFLVIFTVLAGFHSSVGETGPARGDDLVQITPSQQNVSTIQGAVNAVGGTGNNRMQIFDNAVNATPVTYTFTGGGNFGNVVRPGMSAQGISYLDFNGLGNDPGAILHGRNGSNCSYTITSTHQWSTQINAGNGHDQFAVVATSGLLAINAGAGDDFVDIAPGETGKHLLRESHLRPALAGRPVAPQPRGRQPVDGRRRQRFVLCQSRSRRHHYRPGKSAGIGPLDPLDTRFQESRNGHWRREH